MPRPLQILEPFVGQTLARGDDLFRVIARNGLMVILQPEAGGDPERYMIGTPAFSLFEVPDA